MEYLEEHLNRSTGNLETRSIGDWITITEYGEKQGEGRRRTRRILAALGVLRLEGQGKNSRYRLTPEFTGKGLGNRINRRGKQQPFDVISPETQEWIDARWEAARSKLEKENDTPELRAVASAFRDAQKRLKSLQGEARPKVCWFLDHFPRLSHVQIGGLIDVSQSIVTRFANERDTQRQRAEDWKNLDLDRIQDGPKRLPLSYGRKTA